MTSIDLSMVRARLCPAVRCIALVTLLMGLQSCNKKTDTTSAPTEKSAASSSFYGSFKQPFSVPDMTALGRELFFDSSLSASGRASCATCHDPNRAFGPPNDLPVQMLTGDKNFAGVRSVPSLRYLQSVPPFTEHYHDNEDDSLDQGPAGGFTWDGRAQTVHDQARLPLLSPLEMANASPQDVVEKVRRGAHADRFRAIFGANAFDDAEFAFKGVLLALEVFQQSAVDFYPFDSKFDAYLRGETQLTPQELRGLELFTAEDKGNCASCHPAAMRGGGHPTFSDFGLIALGVPRNKAIPVNADATYFDLGLCGPQRKDFANRDEYCGLFRTPSLRNTALRKTFFHNGVFTSLRQVIEFYVQRDTHPQKWYGRRADGKVDKFDDLPERYRSNINVDPPFDKRPGDRPALSASEITDVVAFLNTLTDGYSPPRKPQLR